LCGERKARRTCPALNKQICAVCCGTKRLTQIQCPPDCVYLASARTHPPAAAIRRQQRDVEWFFGAARDLSDVQTRLFLLVCKVLVRYEPGELEALIDADVADAAAAMAATFETASRGLIYEHRPSSLPAERLVVLLKPVFEEITAKGGAAFERSAAAVLRKIEEAARAGRGHEPENRRAFLDLLDRMMAPSTGAPPADGGEGSGRLILP
jgi:hypothetical protein